MAEVTGVSGKQAYDLVLGATPKAYKLVKVKAISPDVITLASGVTTNTTSSAVAGIVGNKTFWMEIAGTGAVSVVITIYGARVSNPTASELVVLVNQFTLSGTTKKVDAAAVSTAAYPYYVVKTESISGTGATVSVYAFY